MDRFKDLAGYVAQQAAQYASAAMERLPIAGQSFPPQSNLANRDFDALMGDIVKRPVDRWFSRRAPARVRQMGGFVDPLTGRGTSRSQRMGVEPDRYFKPILGDSTSMISPLFVNHRLGDPAAGARASQIWQLHEGLRHSSPVYAAIFDACAHVNEPSVLVADPDTLRRTGRDDPLLIGLDTQHTPEQNLRALVDGIVRSFSTIERRRVEYDAYVGVLKRSFSSTARDNPVPVMMSLLRLDVGEEIDFPLGNEAADIISALLAKLARSDSDYPAIGFALKMAMVDWVELNGAQLIDDSAIGNGEPPQTPTDYLRALLHDPNSIKAIQNDMRQYDRWRGRDPNGDEQSLYDLDISEAETLRRQPPSNDDMVSDRGPTLIQALNQPEPGFPLLAAAYQFDIRRRLAIAAKDPQASMAHLPEWDLATRAAHESRKKLMAFADGKPDLKKKLMFVTDDIGAQYGLSPWSEQTDR